MRRQRASRGAARSAPPTHFAVTIRAHTDANHPHAVSSVGTDHYTYDPMANTLSGGGRQYTWNAQGLPSSITSALAGPAPPPHGGARDARAQHHEQPRPREHCARPRGQHEHGRTT